MVATTTSRTVGVQAGEVVDTMICLLESIVWQSMLILLSILIRWIETLCRVYSLKRFVQAFGLQLVCDIPY